jgi:hypothetical protein
MLLNLLYSFTHKIVNLTHLSIRVCFNKVTILLSKLENPAGSATVKINDHSFSM